MSAALSLNMNMMNCAYGYIGSMFTDEYLFDVQVVDSIVRQLNVGKAPYLDNLTAEHLTHSHPAQISILVKLFNIMISCGSFPTSFGRSYTVPVPKGRQASSTVDDLRGISISPVLSKILEHCILDRFSSYLTTSDNQFGSKKGLSCSQAIYSIRSVINSFLSGGSTVSVCAIDLSKAIDKMNHHALFIKLMHHLVQVQFSNY